MLRLSAVFVVCLSVACSSPSLPPSPAAAAPDSTAALPIPDAGRDSDAGRDARDDATFDGGCDLAKPFGPPARALELPSAVLTAAAIGPGSRDLWVGHTEGAVHATRSMAQGPFGDITPVASLPLGPIMSLHVDALGRWMYFDASDATPQGLQAISLGSLVDAGMPAAQPVEGLAAGDRWPYSATNDGQAAMFFTRQNQVHVARLVNPHAVAAPHPVAGLAVAGAMDSRPVLSRDGRNLYFASDRATFNRIEIWRATRGDDSATFSTPERVPELAGAYGRAPLALSDDQCTLYFIWFGYPRTVWSASRGR